MLTILTLAGLTGVSSSVYARNDLDVTCKKSDTSPHSSFKVKMGYHEDTAGKIFAQGTPEIGGSLVFESATKSHIFQSAHQPTVKIKYQKTGVKKVTIEEKGAAVPMCQGSCRLIESGGNHAKVLSRT